MNIFWHHQGHRILAFAQNRTENRVVEPELQRLDENYGSLIDEQSTFAIWYSAANWLKKIVERQDLSFSGSAVLLFITRPVTLTRERTFETIQFTTTTRGY